MRTTTCLTIAAVGLWAGTALAGGYGRYYANDACAPPRPVARCAPTGYWTYQTCRVWVPGCWVARTSPYTGARVVWQSPHYQTRYTQVWVSTAPPPPRQYYRR